MTATMPPMYMPNSYNQSLLGPDTPMKTKQYSSDLSQPIKTFHFARYLSSQQNAKLFQTLERFKILLQKQGVHSTVKMNAAGFSYTGKENTVHCDDCALEVSGWTLDMDPITVHVQRSPKCEFVRTIRPDKIITVTSAVNLPSTTSLFNDDEKPFKRQRTEVQQEICQSNILLEVDTLKQIRRRTFSHWPHRASPSSAQMVEAGFFSCNVGDRVICLYCNIICQQWTAHVDDPWEAHKTISPKCSFVVAMLKRQETSSIRIINENSNNEQLLASNCIDSFRSNEIDYTAAYHTAYIELPRRRASFAAWQNTYLPPVDELVTAGFFYTDTETTVTCFYCNGSLQKWGADDNPTIEHVRRFPHCAYAKQLCGVEPYQKIQELKRHQEKHINYQELDTPLETSDNTLLNESVPTFGDDDLTRMVAARLDLPISQNRLERKFSLSIIKRCWEDQLFYKHEDFATNSDLLIACMVRQKQIEYIDGKAENIIVPSECMRKLRKKEQTGPVSQSQTNDPSPAKPCVICRTAKKSLACMPCGHFVTCVSCGPTLRLCPICGREIRTFVQIYI